MNLEHIKTLIAVYQSGSFHEAAEKLFVPQPTVSNRIQQLEHLVGKKLIVRGRSDNRLTAEGKAFIPYAFKVIEALEQGQLAIKEVEEGGKGSLTIGSTNSFSAYILSGIIQSFTRKFPQINIQVDSYSTVEIIRRVKSGDFHIGFTRYSTNENSLVFHLINNEHIYLIAACDHPFARKPSVTLPEIASEPLILYQKGTQFRETVEHTFNQANVPFHAKFEMNNIELVKQLVSTRLGLTLFAPSYMRKELESGELVKIPVAGTPFPMRQTYMIYNKDALSSLDQLFMGHALAYFKEELAG